jgi:D-alanyl-lipoteichoic acid acyltransferase DltB (MBOAT superfamily)
MSFNSFIFLPFVFLVFILYWYVGGKNRAYQNLILLLSSIFFLAYNDFKSVQVVILSGLVNFVLVKRLARLEEGRLRSLFFYAGVALNIIVLGYFKYLNDIWTGLISMFSGLPSDIGTIMLPLGLSFFTFQLISYWIDVHNEEIEPEDSLLDFGVYLLYFPKMVSGPIELVQNFIPQLKKNKSFDTVLMTDGLRQFLWGLFKKSVVSVSCLQFYNMLYSNGGIGGFDVCLAGVLFITYIYADFSGYSDMACGISKLFGIRITNNFAFPFFSSSISEFWQKWHISLTSWIVRYVFTPMSFMLRKRGKWGVMISIIVSFLIVGIWHGASWGYLLFGFLHGLYFVPLVLKGGSFQSKSKATSWKRLTNTLMTIMLVALTSLFFRTVSLNQTFLELGRMFSFLSFDVNRAIFQGATFKVYWVLIVASFVIEYWNRNQEHGLEVSRLSAAGRWAVYGFMILSIFFFGNFPTNNFVYVQF